MTLAAARAFHSAFKIYRVGLVRGSDSPVGGVTKTAFNGALDKLLASQVDRTEAVKWIERTPPSLSAPKSACDSVETIGMQL